MEQPVTRGESDRGMRARKWAATLVIAAGAALIAPAAAGATPTSFPFDSSSQGWAVGQNNAATAAPFIATGGNPGGFIRYTDAIAETGCPSAAPCDRSFLYVPMSPLTGNYGGSWSFDFKTSVAPSLDDNVFLFINGTSGQLQKEIPPANSLAWQHFSGPLTETGWTFCTSGDVCPAATQAQFKSVLSSADAAGVSPDVYKGTGEQYSLDNFGLTDGPVVTPPPAATSPAATPPAAAPPAAAPAKKKCKKDRKLKRGKCVKKKRRR
jgi:hypothetical protein